ncbi:hypothetical protein [Maledivibacter halophilus]|uniref:Uncharacterized protein n=1 Tax=Maledivibacter halophilus TaxID=36842 RepID=A0A1T5IFF8_9FIRM|nr:hypothetical protein [Maledivibacter halophilus]SKC37877.1 hypothetical protein SAMN02194393_00320 [Maledivibacter halophilus]
MLLKGILLTSIGLIGGIITIILIGKLIELRPAKKSKDDHKDYYNYDGEISIAIPDNDILFENNINSLESCIKKEDSTVLLEDSIYHKEMEETVSLEEKEIQ